MPDSSNYLIGRGELLTRDVRIASHGGDKNHPYSFDENKAYLAPRLQRLALELIEAPQETFPHDEAIGIVRLHPSYLAKSYFPTRLFDEVGLRPVGSRASKVRHRKTTTKKHEERFVTTVEIYAAGKRRNFIRWSEAIGNWSEALPGASELRHVEDLYRDQPSTIIKEGTLSSAKLEAVLHSGPSDEYIRVAFAKYAIELGYEVDLENRQQAGGLCFLSVSGSGSAEELSRFSFLRGLRPMPELRSFSPLRSALYGFDVELPQQNAINPNLRVAVIDGGLPPEPELTKWVSSEDVLDVGAAAHPAMAHGLAVTSAALFGSLEDGKKLERPFANIDHYRVVGTRESPPHYYKILDRVVDVLENNHFDFVNLSLGPEVTLDDDLVHAWSARLDPLLSHGRTLAFVAVGNNGDAKPPKSARLSAPADMVNGIAIGSCEDVPSGYRRASYSARGPGRSPGLVKPDVLAFGGSDEQELFVLDRGEPPSARGVTGTSFATPLALHMALGVAAYFGHELRPLAIKALLIHRAMKTKTHHINEVGWGRIPHDHNNLVTSDSDTAHIVYQGLLRPGKYTRAVIPTPASFASEGRVEITATICFSAEVEPENPINYTRAGLEVYFRPHEARKSDPLKQHADTAPFFKAKDLAQTEAELREDALKWETTLKKTRYFNDPMALQNPVFDIHYIARKGGAPHSSATEIPYAMIITVRQKGFTNLYQRLVQRYRSQLQVLSPAVQVPIRIYTGGEQS